MAEIVFDFSPASSRWEPKARRPRDRTPVSTYALSTRLIWVWNGGKTGYASELHRVRDFERQVQSIIGLFTISAFELRSPNWLTTWIQTSFCIMRARKLLLYVGISSVHTGLGKYSSPLLSPRKCTTVEFGEMAGKTFQKTGLYILHADPYGFVRIMPAIQFECFE